jgi:hypothetical protein
MFRPRPLLPLLVLALLVAAAMPALAAAPVTAPALPALDLSGAACPAAAPMSSATDKLFKAIIIPPDFILCTCKTCREYPDVICQVSPSGFSIVCSDWAKTHCPTIGTGS